MTPVLHTRLLQARRGHLVAGAVVLFALAGCAPSPTLDLGTVPAGVRVVSRLRDYPITSATLTQIRQEMNRLGPTAQGQRWAGAAYWRIDWRYEYNTRALSGCSLNRPRMTVAIDIIVPKWEPEGAPDDAAREWWHHFSAGLMEHEVGHARIAVAGAREIMRAIDGLSGASCDIVVARANAIGQRLLSDINRQQEDYDRETQHGATQIRARTRPAG